ncbi:MAG: S41 family peptidase [Planctomycetota bacterium]
MRYVIRKLMWPVWLAAIALLSAAYTGRIPESVSTPLAVVANGSSSPTGSVESGIVAQACELIYEGKFDAADELIKRTRRYYPAQLNETAGELLGIIDQYQDMSQQRKAAREAAYAETLTELENLQVQDANDANDVNDVNDVVEALSVIAKAGEFADRRQEEQLMSDKFVKQTLQEAIDKAAKFEVEGKWLEAYTNCYYWLRAIDPNNDGYSDYAEQLLDKAALAMVFEDNPCETSEERFLGVKKEMFLRAIEFLDTRYVETIKYEKMAAKAVTRCKLLAEVIGASSQFAEDSQNQDQDSSSATKGMRYPEGLSAWLSSLDSLLDEIKTTSGRPDGLGRKKFLNILETVLRLNESTVGLPRQVLISQFSEAALSALDPYTVIIWPKEIQDFEQMMTNAFTGIGIEISKRKGLLTVSSLLLDTPAFCSDLDAGDVIEAVNGLETKDMSLSCAARKIKGRAGTEVELRVRRPSEDKTVEDKVFHVTITRDRIVVPTVRGWQRTKEGKWLHMVDEQNKIGFVRLTSFSTDTAPGLEKVLDDLESQGLRGLILDLRWNTGGLLDSAVAVADKFIEDGLIVKRKPGHGMPDWEFAKRKGTHPDYPLVILVNAGSASASEIVAGALADKKYERAVLVGGRTHGKGSVQGITGAPRDRAQLKYTMAYYHLPSDQRVESRDAMKEQGKTDWGVAPDIEIKLTSDELKKLYEVQRNNDVLVNTDRDTGSNGVKKYTIEETLASDPQLAVGLLIVKSKLLQDQTLTLARMGN